MFDAILDGYALHEMIFDEQGKPCDYRFLEVNANFEKMTNLKRENIIGKTVLEVLPDTEEFWIKSYGSVVLTGKNIRIENFSKQLNKYFEVVAYKQGDNRFVTLIFDITEKKLIEIALEKSEQAFKNAVKNAPYPIMIHADDGEVIMVNTTWTELTGYTYDEIPTIAAWAEKAYGDQKKPVLEEIESLYLMDGKKEEGEYHVKTKDGKMLIWDFSSAKLGELPDDRILVMSMAKDVTERNDAKAKLSKTLDEAEHMISLMSNRELKMVELKKEIEELKERLSN